MATSKGSAPYIPPLKRLPRWLRPSTLDSYLLIQTMPPFTIATTIVLLALLLERLLTLLNVLASSASPYSTFVKLLADLLPHYMGQALPAALCVAVFVVVRRISESDELDAMMSSGVSLVRVARPFVVCGAVIGLLSVLLFGYLQPHARYQFREGFYFARHAGWAPVLQSGMFATPSGQLMLTADQVDHAGSHLTNVFIRDMRDEKERDITARSGTIRNDRRGGEVQIDLYDGQIMTVLPGQTPTITKFDHAARLLTRTAVDAFRKRGEDERELTSRELSKKISSIRHGVDLAAQAPSPVSEAEIPLQSLRAELHFRLAHSISIPFIPLLAVGLAVIGKRKRGQLGMAGAVLILVTYDHIIQMGKSLVDSGRSSPWLVIWPPTLVFCLGCVLFLLLRGQILPIRRSGTVAPAPVSTPAEQGA